MISRRNLYLISPLIGFIYGDVILNGPQDPSCYGQFICLTCSHPNLETGPRQYLTRVFWMLNGNDTMLDGVFFNSRDINKTVTVMTINITKKHFPCPNSTFVCYIVESETEEVVVSNNFSLNLISKCIRL